MDSLFSIEPNPGTDYAHVWRRVHEVEDAIKRIDHMWHVMKLYLDKNFENEFRLHPCERSWELILGFTLNQCGFKFKTDHLHRLDFAIVFEDRKLWIEATTPKSGVTSDAIPSFSDNNLSVYPEPQIILRIRGKIDDKLKQFQECIYNGSVSQEDYFVIAISGMQFPPIVDDVLSPAILKAVIPIGEPQIWVNRETCIVQDRNTYEYRSKLIKNNGSEVETTCFLDPRYSAISAVLFSDANFLMENERVKSSFIIVHNPLAINVLPKGFFGIGTEIFPVINNHTISWTIT